MNSVLFLIIIPLLGAFLALFAKEANRTIATIIAMFAEIFSIYIFMSGKLPVSVEIGGWQAPFGINFVLTPMSIAFIIMINLAAVVSLLILRGKKDYQFYSTFLVLLAASNGIVLTGDIFNFYIFNELTAFGITALIAYPKTRKSVGAAIKYLILASTASSFLLIGIGLLYKTLGTLNMADIASKIPLLNPLTLELIIVLMLTGIFVELELFPFNMWVPKAYDGGTSSVNVMLHGMLGTAGTYVIARILLTMFSFNGTGVLVSEKILNSVLIVASLTIIISEIAAFNEKNLKKVLAFSSMGQMGIIILAFMIGGRLAITSAFYLVLANFIAKTVLFVLTGEFIKISGSENWEDMKGIARMHPVAGVSFVVASLSLMGIPFFAGFWGKLGLVEAGLSGNLLSVVGVIVVLVAAVIEGIYFLKIAHNLFIKNEKLSTENKARMHSLMIASVLAVLVLVIGINPSLVKNTIDSATNEILDSNVNYVDIVFPRR